MTAQHTPARSSRVAGTHDVPIRRIELDKASCQQRHILASRALALGDSLPMIGELLDHTQVQTAARYAHLANESVTASGSRVGDNIGMHVVSSTQSEATT